MRSSTLDIHSTHIAGAALQLHARRWCTHIPRQDALTPQQHATNTDAETFADTLNQTHLAIPSFPLHLWARPHVRTTALRTLTQHFFWPLTLRRLVCRLV